MMSKKKNWEKVLSSSFVNNNKDLSEEEAKTKVIESQFAIKSIKGEKENDDQLNAAKEIVKELNAGYSAAEKHERAKIEFLLEVIEAKRIAKANAGVS
jgi:hypothetical protein